MSADALAVGNRLRAIASNTPSVVTSASAMIDTDQIYVLSTNGKWYYHNGSSWVAGGEYGAVATDTTLTQSGIPADAKVVGDIVNPMRIATASDVGKALKAKTVTGGKVTEWEFGDVGSNSILCDVDANGNATFSLGEDDLSDIAELIGGTA